MTVGGLNSGKTPPPIEKQAPVTGPVTLTGRNAHQLGPAVGQLGHAYGHDRHVSTRPVVSTDSPTERLNAATQTVETRLAFMNGKHGLGTGLVRMGARAMIGGMAGPHEQPTPPLAMEHARHTGAAVGFMARQMAPGVSAVDARQNVTRAVDGMSHNLKFLSDLTSEDRREVDWMVDTGLAEINADEQVIVLLSDQDVDALRDVAEMLGTADGQDLWAAVQEAVEAADAVRAQAEQEAAAEAGGGNAPLAPEEPAGRATEIGDAFIDPTEKPELDPNRFAGDWGRPGSLAKPQPGGTDAAAWSALHDEGQAILKQNADKAQQDYLKSVQQEQQRQDETYQQAVATQALKRHQAMLGKPITDPNV